MKFDFEKAVKSGVEKAMPERELTIVMTLKEAVEKQIPKKPRFYDSKFRQRGQKYGEFVTIENAYSCPNCNCTVWVTDKDKYCKRCGQALDWGTDE